ncbi:MAG: helix-turn-helix transcriptional regulator [Pseudomonadota bacterium]
MTVLETLNARLLTLMKERGFRPAPLARNADLNESAVRDILRGRSKNPGIVTLHKIASVLGVATSELFEPAEQIPIVGWVGDGGVVSLHDGSSMKTTLSSPFRPGVLDNASALQVRTTTFMPYAREGDMVILETGDDALSDDKMGRVCMCELASDETAIGILTLGQSPGRYRLLPLSVHEQPRIDVQIKKATPLLMPVSRSVITTEETIVAEGEGASEESHLRAIAG